MPCQPHGTKPSNLIPAQTLGRGIQHVPLDGLARLLNWNESVTPSLKDEATVETDGSRDPSHGSHAGYRDLQTKLVTLALRYGETTEHRMAVFSVPVTTVTFLMSRSDSFS